MNADDVLSIQYLKEEVQTILPSLAVNARICVSFPSNPIDFNRTASE